MASKKSKGASAKKDGTRINKSAWIRSQPASLSAKEVVDKAAGESIKLSLAQVYTARSTAKNKPAGRKKAGATAEIKRGPGRPKSSGKVAVRGDLQKQFMTLAIRIGSDEARRLLDRIFDVERGG
jgi:hypothetical protein